MRERLGDKERELFLRPNFGHLATLSPDGRPQVSPVWVDLEGDLILVNTAAGRVKERNVRRDPRVAISIHDDEDPYNRAYVQGRVVEITEEGADEHIDFLAKKYTGKDRYDRPPDQRRVILKIAPERVASKVEKL